MDVYAVRAGLATNAATIGLRATAYAPDQVNVPAFFTDEVEIDFDQAFGRGMDNLTFTCRLLVSRADDRSGQKLLDGYISGSGPSSIKAAVESNDTLGGACDDLQVLSIGNYGGYEHNGVLYYGAEVTVRVIGSG